MFEKTLFEDNPRIRFNIYTKQQIKNRIQSNRTCSLVKLYTVNKYNCNFFFTFSPMKVLENRKKMLKKMQFYT